MRRIFVITFLMLACSLAAFADSNVVFKNAGGSVFMSNSGVTLSKSKLVEIDDPSGNVILPVSSSNHSLGQLNFTTGAEISSTTVDHTTTFTYAGGGSFIVTGNGQSGVPKGVIFNGTFSGPVTVVETTHSKGGPPPSWLLTGNVTGTYNGQTVNGITVQLKIAGVNGGKVNGSTTLATVPEPGTLGLLGTGLLGVAGLVRRKVKSQ